MRWVFADFFLQKGARLRFLFAKLLLCPWLSKKKRTRKLCAGAICSSFFCFFSLSGQRKEDDFCLFAKIFCYSVDFEKEKGLNFPFLSQSPHGVHAPPYRKMQLHFFVFDMDIWNDATYKEKGDIKTGRQAGCSPIDRGAVSFHLSGIDPLTMGWEANRTDCRQHQRGQ